MSRVCPRNIGKKVVQRFQAEKLPEPGQENGGLLVSL